MKNICDIMLIMNSIRVIRTYLDPKSELIHIKKKKKNPKSVISWGRWGHFSLNFLAIANAAPAKATTIPEIIMADFIVCNASFFSLSFFFPLASSCSFNKSCKHIHKHYNQYMIQLKMKEEKMGIPIACSSCRVKRTFFSLEAATSEDVGST